MDVGTESGHPIAEKLVARVKRDVRGKVVDLSRANETNRWTT
jgi:hypothetical protein